MAGASGSPAAIRSGVMDDADVVQIGVNGMPLIQPGLTAACRGIRNATQRTAATASQHGWRFGHVGSHCMPWLPPHAMPRETCCQLLFTHCRVPEGAQRDGGGKLRGGGAPLPHELQPRLLPPVHTGHRHAGKPGWLFVVQCWFPSLVACLLGKVGAMPSRALPCRCPA